MNKRLLNRLGGTWKILGLTTAGLALTSVAWTAHADHGPSQGQSKKLINDVQAARLIDLTHTWSEESPLLVGLNPPFGQWIDKSHGQTIGTFGDVDQLSFTGDAQHFSGQHGAPTMDALGHIGHDGKLHGGVDAIAATSDSRGLGASGVGAELAMDAFPASKMANRGVLLDVARWYHGGGSAPLPASFRIKGEHLEATAEWQGVEVRAGDTVLIRTGWGQFFGGSAEERAKYASGETCPAGHPFAGASCVTGIDADGADWLAAQDVFAAGADTMTFEAHPPVYPGNGVDFSEGVHVFWVHQKLLTDAGIYIIENYNLEELSAAHASEFVVVTPPLKTKGATGSALRSFALVP